MDGINVLITHVQILRIAILEDIKAIALKANLENKQLFCCYTSLHKATHILYDWQFFIEIHG